MAVTPGSTLMSSVRHVGSPASTASNTAAAMAKTPDHRRTPRRPAGLTRPVPAHGAHGRARRDCPKRGGIDRHGSPERDRDRVHSPQDRWRDRGRRVAGVMRSALPGPVPTTTSEPVTTPLLTGDQDHREIGASEFTTLSQWQDAFFPAWCRARHRQRATAGRPPRRRVAPFPSCGPLS